MAVLIGPAGMGVVGLFMATIGLIQRTANMGLNISAVRDLAAAKASDKPIRVARYYKTLSRLIIITGLLGAGFTLVFSSWLSQITFGSKEYTIAFVWISLSILFTQISSGYFTILQGLQNLKSLAKANLIGSTTGLIIGLPLYFWFRMDAIVPNILIGSIASLAFSRFYVKKIDIRPLKLSMKRTLIVGRNMLYFGFILNITALITLGNFYLLRLYISNTGSLEQVGLYTAGIAILNNYVGMIFTAMSTDYYPRLAGVVQDTKNCNETINQQAEMALIIMAPIIIIFMIAINFVLILFYSSKFIPANSMLQWAALGMLPKAASWAIAFIILAKGASKLFFLNELITNIYSLGFAIVGYKYFGLKGIGIAIFTTYVLYLLQVYIIARVKYKFAFERVFIKIFITNIVFTACAFILVVFNPTTLNYFFATAIFILSSVYSIYEMNERIDIKDVFDKVLLRFKR